MAQRQEKNYINGMFVKRIDGKFGPQLLVSLNDEALSQINDLPSDEKGFRRLVMSPQKDDETKLSTYENDYKRESYSGGPSGGDSSFKPKSSFGGGGGAKKKSPWGK